MRDPKRETLDVTETLQKYPVAAMLGRKSLSSYTFRDTKITIPKGQTIIIPVYAIHHDPTIYPNPEVYDPERFTKETIQSRDPMHFIPFGYGSRYCIEGGYIHQTSVFPYERQLM